MIVGIGGSEIEWPAYRLAEERACLRAFFERLRERLQLGEVDPGDPIERLGQLTGDDALRVRAELETLEQMDRAVQPALAQAISSDLAGLMGPRIPDSGPFPGRGSTPSLGA
jgi:hypothetical protein